MTTPALPTAHRGMRAYPARGMMRPGQRGVVLIISLIMILVISVLAVTSMRNAASSESVSGNVRTTELATQAAEIALRHCESSVLKAVKKEVCLAPPDPTDPELNYDEQGLDIASSKILYANTAIQWKTTNVWDNTRNGVYVLPSALLGGTTTFTRPPECMVESLTGSAQVCTPASFVVTARGFGPEVQATVTGRPVGTVVWLQSTLDIRQPP